MFDAERKKWDAPISNKPAFLSKNADAFECHLSERLRWDRSADLVCRSGDVSLGTDDASGSSCSPGPIISVEHVMVIMNSERENAISGNLGGRNAKRQLRDRKQGKGTRVENSRSASRPDHDKIKRHALPLEVTTDAKS